MDKNKNIKQNLPWYLKLPLISAYIQLNKAFGMHNEGQFNNLKRKKILHKVEEFRS